MSRQLKSPYHSTWFHQWLSLSLHIYPHGGFLQPAEGGIKCLNFVYRWEGLVFGFKPNVEDDYIHSSSGMTLKREWMEKDHCIGQSCHDCNWSSTLCGRISDLRWPRASPTGQGPGNERTGESEKRCARVQTRSYRFSSSQEVLRFL